MASNKTSNNNAPREIYRGFSDNIITLEHRALKQKNIRTKNNKFRTLEHATLDHLNIEHSNKRQ